MMKALRWWVALVALVVAGPAWAQEPEAASPGLYDRPVLVLDPGMHTAMIRRADVDAGGRYAVTGSDDKTVRVWSLADQELLRTIRLPAGPGHIGKVFAVAISPDGALIAAGGWTRSVGSEIYLFDRATGTMVRRIEGLPNVVYHLIFSTDGRYLAATLSGGNGLRVYDRDNDWAEVARDIGYGDDSYGAAFAPDGRLATTSYDGYVRLYDAEFALMARARPPGGRQPYGIAFSPDGRRLAGGYYDTASVDLLDGASLAPLPGPDTAGIDNGGLNAVAWSTDGATLFAGGRYNDGSGNHPVVAWSDAGAGERRSLAASRDAIMSLKALPDGGLLIGAADPALVVLNGDGAERWAVRPPQADLRDQRSTLAVSHDGSVVDFGYEAWGEAPARFDLRTLDLSFGPPYDDLTAKPEQAALPVEDWINSYRPTLAGEPLPLEPYEFSRSLAIDPDGGRFVLGTEWSLRAFDRSGEELWRRDVPGTVWAVNITGDGRLVVAAYHDGTIRWHRMDDGRELLAFFPLADHHNWVAWTPEGFYAATPGAYGVLRWHVNHGWDQAAEAVPVNEIPGSRRPEVLPLVLQEMETVRALGLAELQKHRRQVQIRTGAAVAPGARLHVLAIGVSDYGEAAKHLRLNYADRDARDIATALINTQTSLYAKVLPQLLTDKNATRAAVLRGLATMRQGMAAGEGRDLAVVHFSGHGAMIDGALYLLPYGVDARDPVSLRASALRVSELRDELRMIGEQGRVLVFLDACHSGSMNDGTELAVNATSLRTRLAAANVTVLTSSQAAELSRESAQWDNGAFTEVLLEALHKADANHNSLISVGELMGYLNARVPQLTENRQTPGIEVRFESDVFVAGL